MLEQTPLWVKSLGVGLVGFFLVGMTAAWNFWIHDGGFQAVVFRLSGVDYSGKVYPTVPWAIVALVAAATILVILGLSVDKKWRQRQRRLAAGRAEESRRKP